MTRLTLFHTAGCHLCEEADALLAQCLTARPMTTDRLKRVDIADDDVLLERYKIRIPVLLDEDSGRELDWPFNAIELNEFLFG